MTSPITLPGGGTYTPSHHDPDTTAMTPLVTDLADGTALVSFVSCDVFTPSDDPVADALHVLRSYRSPEAVFTADLYSPQELSEHLDASGDNLLDRVVFIRHTPTGVEAVGRKAAMDDWDEYKDFARDFDAALVLPRAELDNYPALTRDWESGLAIRDFSDIAADINEVAGGRSYTVVHHRVSLATADLLAAGTDDYDATLHDAADAEARAESQHADVDDTLSMLESVR